MTTIPQLSNPARIRQRARPVTLPAWDENPPPPGELPRIICLFTAARDLDPLVFLRQAQGSERFFWSEPRSQTADPLVLAGAGIAAEIIVPPVLAADDDNGRGLADDRFRTVVEQARHLFRDAYIHEIGDGSRRSGDDAGLINPLLRPRLFGGFAFQDDFTPDNTWSVFNPAHFVLPHYLLIERQGNRYLAINALLSPHEDLPAAIQALEEALLARLALPAKSEPAAGHGPPAERHYPTDRSLWTVMVDSARDEIAAGRLEKVVLSRVCEIKDEAPIDAVDALERLNAAGHDCYRFLFEPVPHHAFFGATPELLARLQGRSVETMALAGTTGRGKSVEEDERLTQGLLASGKDRYEHQLVVDAITTQLGDLMDVLEFDPQPEILKLPNVQHLHTSITGNLHQEPGGGVLDLVRRLHPTPAMGGVPVAGAIRFLRRTEPVPRGWYAGPIGWIDDRLDGVFAVAIRSAVTQHRRAWLYAGAGIVAESHAEREWAETALKFRTMLAALGVEEGGRHE
jgi:menaquinone-specific isochorismate synthase